MSEQLRKALTGHKVRTARQLAGLRFAERFHWAILEQEKLKERADAVDKKRIQKLNRKAMLEELLPALNVLFGMEYKKWDETK